MVGQDTKMMFARKMDKYIDKPFKPGGTGRGGYDCFGLIYSWCLDNGIEVKPIDGWTAENYSARMEWNIDEAERIMLAAFDAIGEPVAASRILAGDILVVKAPKGQIFPAIYCGNSRALSSFLIIGTRVFSLKDIEIIVARRIR